MRDPHNVDAALTEILNADGLAFFGIPKRIDEEFVREILKDLPDRTRTIMKMRYGLGDENDPEDWQNEHTLEEIGDYLGLTRERIRQIEKQTLQELKVKFAKYAR